MLRLPRAVAFGLYEEIMGSKVYIKDFKEIEKYIKNKRLNEVYALLDFVRQYKKSL